MKRINCLTRVATLTFVTAALASPASPALAEESFKNATGPTIDAGAVVLRSRLLHPEASSAGVPCYLVWKGSLPANRVSRLYSANWPHAAVVTWTMVGDTTASGPAVSLALVATQQTDAAHTTYWLAAANLTSSAQVVEARACLL